MISKLCYLQLGRLSILNFLRNLRRTGFKSSTKPLILTKPCTRKSQGGTTHDIAIPSEYIQQVMKGCKDLLVPLDYSKIEGIENTWSRVSQPVSLTQTMSTLSHTSGEHWELSTMKPWWNKRLNIGTTFGNQSIKTYHAFDGAWGKLVFNSLGYNLNSKDLLEGNGR